MEGQWLWKGSMERRVANGVCFIMWRTGTLNHNPHPDIFDCPREVEDNGEWYYQMRQEEGEKGLLEWALSTENTRIWIEPIIGSSRFYSWGQGVKKRLHVCDFDSQRFHGAHDFQT